MAKPPFSVSDWHGKRLREDVVRAVAEHLAFQRLWEEVAKPIQKLIGLRVREGVLAKEGPKIVR